MAEEYFQPGGTAADSRGKVQLGELNSQWALPD
jgi:hypothetical protein